MDIHFGSQICTTRIDIEAFTRDERGENWGTYIVFTNRDGVRKRLAVPLALIGADKVTEIAGLLASLGVGVIPSRQARQLLVQFLTLNVSARVTAVPQIGWHCSDGVWVFVLPDDTIVPAGFDGPGPSSRRPACMCNMGSTCGESVERMDRADSPAAGRQQQRAFVCRHDVRRTAAQICP